MKTIKMIPDSKTSTISDVDKLAEIIKNISVDLLLWNDSALFYDIEDRVFYKNEINETPLNTSWRFQRIANFRSIDYEKIPNFEIIKKIILNWIDEANDRIIQTN